MNPVWIIDDDRSIRWVFEKALAREEIPYRSFGSATEALAAMDGGSPPPQVMVSDIRMPGESGLGLLQKVKNRYPDLPVIIMTAYSDLDSAVQAFQGGAFEYLPKPFDVDQAVDLVRRAIDESMHQESVPEAANITPEILGKAASMQEVFRAFIAINTAAIPRDLLESELFGHERGAFTGAAALRRGRFEQAEGGTLFLDEIGDMPIELQTRLLRVLSDGTFYRVGGQQPIRANVRVIAATHQNMEERVKLGLFREDLLHRLNVIRLRLPPLRERRDDIPLLARHFMQKSAQDLGVEAKRLSDGVLRYLATLDFPGNVRQLENLCHWLTVMAPGQTIEIKDLPSELREAPARDTQSDWIAALAAEADRMLVQRDGNVFDVLSRAFERTLIERALAATAGRRIEASQLLGIGRNTITRKIQELGIEGGRAAPGEEDSLPRLKS
ncbi:MAG: ntrC [Proteobacteria bacterium]|nr:ntrC [Pseudomonadota bacterium]